MIEQKDVWDKLEVLLKGFVPVAVGLMLLGWNNQRTTQQTAASMIQIATDILAGEVTNENEPLRDWAIDVLQTPTNPPALSTAAAERLRSSPLPTPLLKYSIWTAPDGTMHLIIDDGNEGWVAPVTSLGLSAPPSPEAAN